MRLSSVAAALSLAASPLSAQAVQPQIDDVDWSQDGDGKLEGFVLECGSLVTSKQCFDKASQDSQLYKVPVYVIRTDEKNRTAYFQVTGRKVAQAHEEDVRPMLMMHDTGSKPTARP